MTAGQILHLVLIDTTESIPQKSISPFIPIFFKKSAIPGDIAMADIYNNIEPTHEGNYETTDNEFL
jgi:hypothetical protein